MASKNQSDPVNERIPGAEPAPKWPEAKEKYEWAWELHYIGLACVYIMVALYSLVVVFFILLRRRRLNKQKAMAYVYAVHILLVLFGITRAAFLLTDPYELNSDFPLVSTRLLFGLGFPCLTSSYSLLHIGFLEISRVNVYGNKLNRKRFVCAVITLHFVVVIVADTTTALKRETALLLLVCMSFFIFWGFAISISILYSGGKLLRKCKKQRDTIRSLSRYRDSQGGTTEREREMFSGSFRHNRVKKTARITLLTAVLAMSCCICNLLALVGVYNVYRGVQANPEPWQWWCFQTAFRVIEIALGVVMGYAVTPVNLRDIVVLRQDTERTMAQNLSQSHARSERVCPANNTDSPSRSQSLHEKTGAEARCASLDSQVPSKTKFEKELPKGLPRVSSEEKLSSKEMDKLSFSPEPLSFLILRSLNKSSKV